MALGNLPAWYELAEALALAVGALLVLVRIWTAVDSRSRLAARLRPGDRAGAGHTLRIVFGLCVFIVTAEEILTRDPNEPLPWLDLLVRQVARVAASQPLVKWAASALSELSGSGLVGAVLTSVVGLVAVRRRHEAFVLAAGTVSAWLLSALLKLGFAVGRPRGMAVHNAITAYGFPSAHVLVAVVAAGLIVWGVAGRVTGSGWALSDTTVVAVAGLTGAARLILAAHWLSDIIAGFAIGLVWLHLVILLDRHRERRRTRRLA